MKSKTYTSFSFRLSKLTLKCKLSLVEPFFQTTRDSASRMYASALVSLVCHTSGLESKIFYSKR